MLHLQSISEKNTVSKDLPENSEVIELSDGMRHFLDAVIKRMLEKDIKQYYSSNHLWEQHACPQSKPQAL